MSFCTGKKIISPLMLIISNHYGIKCLSNELHLQQCNISFIVISDIMAHWNEMRNTQLFS